MDAIDFYHQDDTSTDIYEAMEQYLEAKLKELIKQTPNDTDLGKLIREKYGI